MYLLFQAIITSLFESMGVYSVLETIRHDFNDCRDFASECDYDYDGNFKRYTDEILCAIMRSISFAMNCGNFDECTNDFDKPLFCRSCEFLLTFLRHKNGLLIAADTPKDFYTFVSEFYSALEFNLVHSMLHDTNAFQIN